MNKRNEWNFNEEHYRRMRNFEIESNKEEKIDSSGRFFATILFAILIIVVLSFSILI